MSDEGTCWMSVIGIIGIAIQPTTSHSTHRIERRGKFEIRLRLGSTVCVSIGQNYCLFVIVGHANLSQLHHLQKSGIERVNR